MSKTDSKLFSISDKPEEATPFVPLYDVAHVYDIDNENERGEKRKRSSMRNCCWNCGGESHSMNQCNQPTNPTEIAKNRALFSRGRKNNEFKRYHIDTKEEMYSNFKPGALSETLREALGLKDNQMAKHIYMMRVLGYPPGWLLEAKCNGSGIEMFDIEGKRVPNADEEEGEIGISHSMYDEDKIITFAGFNAWPDPGTKDETRHYNVPELKDLPSKEDFIKILNSECVHQYSEDGKSPKAELTHVPDTSDDMETEEIHELKLLSNDKCGFIPPLPDSDVPPPPPLPPPPQDGAINEKASIEFIEQFTDKFNFAINTVNIALDIDQTFHIEAKNTIRKAIYDLNCSFVKLKEDIFGRTEQKLTCVTPTRELENNDNSLNGDESGPENSTVNEDQQDVNSDFCSETHGRIKSIELGTPVLKIHSPYSRLPPPESFQKNISDVINFENLPDSTGAFEKLKDVLKSVQTKMIKLKGNKLNATF